MIRNYPIGIHFKTINMTSFKFQGIEMVTDAERGGNIDEIHNRGEVYWIFNLQTLYPKGWNNEIPWHVML